MASAGSCAAKSNPRLPLPLGESQSAVRIPHRSRIMFIFRNPDRLPNGTGPASFCANRFLLRPWHAVKFRARSDHQEMIACAECERLELTYRLAVDHIYEAVGSMYPSLREKVLELHRWQDRRDETIEDFYQHKKNHTLKKPPGSAERVASGRRPRAGIV